MMYFRSAGNRSNFFRAVLGSRSFERSGPIRERPNMLPRFVRIVLILALLARTAVAQTDSPGAVRLVFDGSAAGLSQDLIRAAVGRELGALATDPAPPGTRELRIATNPDGDIVLSYAADDKQPMQRVLHAASRPEDTAELVALAAATLVRNQREATPPPGEAAPAAKDNSPLPPTPKLDPQPEIPSAEPAVTKVEKTPRNLLGVIAGVDYLFVPSTTDACNEGPRLAFNQVTFSCYKVNEFPAAGRGPDRGGAIASGMLRGTSRFALSYDRAVTEHFRAGIRLGFANDSTPLQYLPIHAELRFAHWFGEPRPGAFRGGLFAAIGAARMTGRTQIEELRDGTFVTQDVYPSIGWLFTSVGAGLIFQPTEALELEVSLPLVAFLPKSFGFTPQIAGRVAF
jgi:hypothetical protein